MNKYMVLFLGGILRWKMLHYKALTLLILLISTSSLVMGQVSIKATGRLAGEVGDGPWRLIGEADYGPKQAPKTVRLRSYAGENQKRYVLSSADWSISFYADDKDIINLKQSMLLAVEGQRFEIDLGSSHVILFHGVPFWYMFNYNSLSNPINIEDLMTMSYESEDSQTHTIVLSKVDIYKLFGGN